MNAPIKSTTSAVGRGTLDRSQIAAIYLSGYKNTTATAAAAAVVAEAVTRSCSSTADTVTLRRRFNGAEI